ncbi:MAG: hypothetical protein JF885_03480 [Candidatus Dormibacteraeota bacterium]|nr:hypothetical protein [Candidatus Dormibacteraeota bacterium]MBJ7610879.1 hypothetical protein [Candidatus Dormibacteraeota bacterium]
MADLFSPLERLAAARAGVDVARAALVRTADHLRYAGLVTVAVQMEEVARLSIVWDAEIQRAVDNLRS